MFVGVRPQEEPPVYVVEADRPQPFLRRLPGRVREIWAFRALLWNMVIRDLKARYKSSVLGYLWTLLNPLLMMLVFTLVFQVLFRHNIAFFPIFILVALLAWNYCQGAVVGGMVSITGNANLVKKVYFPREILPLASVLSHLVNYVFALPVLVLLIWAFGMPLTPYALLWPVLVLIETVFLLGVAFFVATLNVFFRDTEVLMNILLQAWFFLTPIFYPIEAVVGTWRGINLARVLRWLNPMASLVDFYRDIFYGGVTYVPATPAPGLPAWDGVLRTFVTALLVLGIGYAVFLRYEGRFAEEL